MNKDQFLDYHKEMCGKMYNISKSKSHDYSGFVDSVFGNFEAVERMDVTSTEVGLMTRILDKFSRINSFVKQGVCLVADEKIEDSCIDAANYFILLSAYINQKKDGSI